MLAAGADTVHFDVMDNHYVPNLTIGPMVCSALRKYGIEAPIDVHLMVSPVDKIIGEFADAGASFITFHPEATEHVDRSLQLVRAAGCKSGLVFNPATSLDVLKYVMDKVEPPPARPTHSPPHSAIHPHRAARRRLTAAPRPCRQRSTSCCSCLSTRASAARSSSRARSTSCARRAR